MGAGSATGVTEIVGAPASVGFSVALGAGSASGLTEIVACRLVGWSGFSVAVVRRRAMGAAEIVGGPGRRGVHGGAGCGKCIGSRRGRRGVLGGDGCGKCNSIRRDRRLSGRWAAPVSRRRWCGKGRWEPPRWSGHRVRAGFSVAVGAGSATRSAEIVDMLRAADLSGREVGSRCGGRCWCRCPCRSDRRVPPTADRAGRRSGRAAPPHGSPRAGCRYRRVPHRTRRRR